MTSNDRAAGMATLLARALAALTATHVPDAPAPDAFAAAIARMDEADATYLAAIERILPPAKAAEMLAALASFRDDVFALRERTRAETGYGDFDPLDTHVPALAVSHGQSVRIADTADRARAQVTTLRATVNARIGALLERDEIDRLSDAKRARNAAFDAAVRAALPAEVTDRLGTLLMLLADGWY
jgi:hypothetical protein